MAAPPKPPAPDGLLQSMLQAAVQSVQWTYSLFWQFCPQQRVLVWRDGYYNGSIKTRKTVQPAEGGADEASLQRSQQLRELYDSLVAGEVSPQQLPPRRPSAALSPEDLTESEWFYLMCVSFSFAPGTGLPGKAYSKRRHVWLAGANEVESRAFSRAILAKSARIQTVVCIPLLDGVVELGTTDKVREDHGFVRRVRSFFVDGDPPRPVPSEHSTSDPASSAAHRRSLHLPAAAAADDDEDESGGDSGSGGGSGPDVQQLPSNPRPLAHELMAQPAELMQLDMSEDIRLGSPDDCSNNLDSDFHFLAVAHPEILPAFRRREDRRPPDSGNPWPMLDEFFHDDAHYSQTVAVLLHVQSLRWPSDPSSAVRFDTHSAFSRWTSPPDRFIARNSQRLLKYILVTVPFLHAKASDPPSALPHDNEVGGAARFRGILPEDVGANHVLAERRRRVKLNERFIILRSLVPFVTKMDKASILGDAIEYVKQLRRRIEDLEAAARETEVERRQTGSGPDKKKLRAAEGGAGRPKAAEQEAGVSIEVSIIEGDALLELRYPYREGLLLDIMQLLRDLRVETTSVQSSVKDGIFVAELRAKVKEDGNGKRVSIVEVKRAVKQVLPHRS